jgi:L-seryl-tRNA(Ser) seleniumtransferase
MRRARRLAAQLTASGIDAAAAPSEARVGGGGAPGLVLSSAAVTLPARFGPALRCGDPAVVGRVESGRFVLDLRAVPAELDGEIAAAIARAARTSAGPPADPPAATAGPATGAAAPPPGAGRIPDRRRRVLDRARPRRP